MKSSTKRVNILREAEARWTPEQARLASILREAGCDVFAISFVSGGASVTVFGRTCGDVDNVTHHTMGLIWSGFSADEQVARRLVRYAVNRGWKLTECTADHPLRDLWPGQMGEPTLVKP